MTPDPRHRDRRGAAATRQLRKAFVDRLPDPGSAPDPERAGAFAKRRASRWRRLRRRWVHVLTGASVVVVLTLLIVALRPTPFPATFTSVRIENNSAQHHYGVALENDGREYFVGFVARGETLSYAVRSIRPEGLALSLSDRVVARCCEIPPEASEVIVFQLADDPASGESLGTVVSRPK